MGHETFSNKCLPQLHACISYQTLKPPLKEVAVGRLFFLVLTSVDVWKRNNSSRKSGFLKDGLKKSMAFPTHNDVSIRLSKRENRSSGEGAEQRKLNALAIILSLGYATSVLQCLSIYPSPAKAVWHLGFILMW